MIICEIFLGIVREWRDEIYLITWIEFIIRKNVVQ